jgi:SAM-dependent methyltransferase
VDVDEVRDAYGALSQAYVDRFGSVESTHDDDLARITRWAEPLEGPVLDAGCGPGQMSGHLHALGLDVRGIDLVPEFIKHARAAYPEVRFEVGSMTDLDLPDGALAGVLAWYSLIHLAPAEIDLVLRELRRVLAPGGSLLIGFFEHPGDVPQAFAHKVVDAFAWPADVMVNRLRSAGFEEIDRWTRPATGMARPHAALAARAVA